MNTIQISSKTINADQIAFTEYSHGSEGGGIVSVTGGSTRSGTPSRHIQPATPCSIRIVFSGGAEVTLSAGEAEHFMAAFDKL